LVCCRWRLRHEHEQVPSNFYGGEDQGAARASCGGDFLAHAACRWLSSSSVLLDWRLDRTCRGAGTRKPRGLRLLRNGRHCVPAFLCVCANIGALAAVCGLCGRRPFVAAFLSRASKPAGGGSMQPHAPISIHVTIANVPPDSNTAWPGLLVFIGMCHSLYKICL